MRLSPAIVLAQIVLGDGDIAFANDAAFPGGEAHVRPGGVGTLGDEFRRGLAGGGEVELVLDSLEEDLGLGIGGVVIGCEGEDVPHLQIDPFLAGADVADALQQFIEVIGDTERGRVLEPLVVHGEALAEVFLQPGHGPLPELGAALAADAEADGEDGIEVVVVHQPFDLPGTLVLNYPEFPDSCPRGEFTLLVDVLEVLVDGADVLLKQVGHELLREPDSLVLKPALDARLAVLGLVENDLSTLRDGLL